ncbi:MAG: hypothetical protein Ct9H300mP12_16360 [Acidimicrobiales bacterium]|nr:MAG: hypothetical protein Ct9H300mP12_16360 [Acidimicrobiales bacterium]
MDGHALGNLLIAGLIAASDDLVSALDEIVAWWVPWGGYFLPRRYPSIWWPTRGSGRSRARWALHPGPPVWGTRLDPSDAAAPPETVPQSSRLTRSFLDPGRFSRACWLPHCPRRAGGPGRRAGPLVLVANLTRDREGPMDLADHVHLWISRCPT